jgi:hypothetical protein
VSSATGFDESLVWLAILFLERRFCDFERFGIADPATMQRLAQYDGRLQAFRQKLLPARNKLISHSDRGAVLAGQALGGAPQNEWDEFWLNLQDVVCIVYEKVFGTPFYINGVAMLSDAHGLLKALKHGACFDHVVCRRC